MNKEFIVEGNRKVEIKSILQHHTYETIVEGTSTADLNNLRIEKVKKNAQQEFGLNNIFLIEPKQTPSQSFSLFEKKEIVKLPPIICIAKLYDYYFDSDADYATLTIIWFQNDFAFPIEPDILEQIKKIPFSNLAEKHYF